MNVAFFCWQICHLHKCVYIVRFIKHLIWFDCAVERQSYFVSLNTTKKLMNDVLFSQSKSRELFIVIHVWRCWRHIGSIKRFLSALAVLIAHVWAHKFSWCSQSSEVWYTMNQQEFFFHPPPHHHPWRLDWKKSKEIERAYLYLSTHIVLCRQ